ncbi:MAG: carboxypeptidase regulatory-like domain-containing protein [Terriglobales bacterium]
MKRNYNRLLTVVLTLLVMVGVGVKVGSRKAIAAADGKITGTVKLNGTAPHMRGIDMSKDPYCVKAHANDPAHSENVVVGKGDGLENVVLYISEGLSASELSSKPTQIPIFDQKGCMYTPHVLAMDVGQEFKVETSDATAHNIHPQPNPLTGNIPWNQSQPPGAPPVIKSWKAPEMIHVQCNIHPWMSGWFAVVKGPYATTDENGAYTIQNVPPGSYTVTAWQETYGTQTQKVTVAAGGAATADFTFKAK